MPRHPKYSVICACYECKWHADNSGACICPTISLATGIVQTKHQGAMPYWKCNCYEMSERAKKIKAHFDSIMRKE